MIERLNANIKVDGGKEIHHNVRNKQNQRKVEPDKSQV